MANDTQVTEYPTVSYGSFVSALDKFAEADGAPNEIHPSAFDKVAFNGSTIALLVKAFRSLGLSNEKNEPIPDRLDPLIETKTRKDAFGKLLRERYGTLISLPLERATNQQFNEWFAKSGMASEAQRKARTFFLHAARANGISVSKYVLDNSKTRTPAKRDKKPRTPKNPNDGGANGPKDPVNPTNPGGESLAQKFLDKFPEFNPDWSAEVQQKWFDGLAKLQDTIKKMEGSDS
jgi:hypothetical protein